MKKLLYFLIFGFTVGFFVDAQAQMSRRQIKQNNRRMMTFRGKKQGFGKEKRYDMISLTINALNYYGDLAPKPSRLSTNIGLTKPAIGLSYSHRFGPRYTLTGSFMYGAIKGSDAESADEGDAENGVFRYQRNLSFRNRIKELSVVASLDLFENQSTYISRVNWTPYAYAGLAVFHHNPQAQVPGTDLNGNPFPNAGEWVDLQPLGTEGQYATLLETDVNHGIKEYKNIQFAIPFGVGARFRLNEVFDFSVEFGFRYLFTDYLDDVSQNYVDLGVFGSNELAKALSYRGNEIGSGSTNTYIGRDGNSYTVIPGYGQESKDNWRGNKNDKDIYTVTTLRISYIIGKTFSRAKFR
ncbi:MAG TPA: DUF6089 family protein [Cyclobacteriaceae bacterium]|nr:DUF6089 family protein [Cyclobacteriaceae bacterium]